MGKVLMMSEDQLETHKIHIISVYDDMAVDTVFRHNGGIFWAKYFWSNGPLVITDYITLFYCGLHYGSQTEVRGTQVKH